MDKAITYEWTVNFYLKNKNRRNVYDWTENTELPELEGEPSYSRKYHDMFSKAEGYVIDNMMGRSLMTNYIDIAEVILNLPEVWSAFYAYTHRRRHSLHKNE